MRRASLIHSQWLTCLLLSVVACTSSEASDPSIPVETRKRRRLRHLEARTTTLFDEILPPLLAIQYNFAENETYLRLNAGDQRLGVADGALIWVSRTVDTNDQMWIVGSKHQCVHYYRSCSNTMLLGACSETIDCYQLRHASTELYLQATCDGRACSGHQEVTLVPSPQGAGALWYFVGNTATEVRLQNSRLGQTLGGEAAAVASFQPDNSQQPVSLDVDRLNVADYVQAAGIQFAMRNLHTSDFLWSDWEGYEYRLHPQRDLSLSDGRAHWQFQPINCDGDTSSTASKECSSIASVATEAILGGSGTHAYVTPGAEPFFEDVHAFHIQVVACDDMGSTSPATLGCIRIQSAIQSGRVIGIHYDEAKGQKELYLTDRSKDPSSNDLAWTWELLPASSGN